jgi:catechol 2,3-dioxygenase-like lactoylglutathione lyase family enzyme
MHLNQVTVSVTDIPRSVSFYEGLGLELIVRAEHYARFLLGNGATFSVHKSDKPPASGTIIYFECADLDDFCQQLVEKGFVFEQEPLDQSWLWREAYLNDPDGNKICLYFAGEMRINPPWRLPKNG